MSTPTQTPELTVANTAVEIKAAMEQQAAQPEVPVVAEPVTPPAPAEQLPYTIVETPEGVEIRLETGGVYKGKTLNEAVTGLAKGKIEADKTLHQNKQAAPAPAPTPALTPEQQEALTTQNWVLDHVAKGLGLQNADQLRVAMGQMYGNTQQAVINNEWTSFVTQCPDYADTPENATALVEYLPESVIAQQRPPTAGELKHAHAAALYDKKYAPVATSTAVSQPPRPPAMPTAGAGTQPGEPDPYKMPISDLRKAAFSS